MQVWQLQEHFCNNYMPTWTLLKIQRIYSVGKNEKSNFYELWQYLKQLKSMKMSEAWPDIYKEG